jgi:S-adenosyl-L-methionine hydrolase (adenosine-forming)
MNRPVVFITDYGRDDTYAASLVGAAWAVDPATRCVYGPHGIPPGDILAGAYHLKAVRFAFDRCVLCGVVDPGVGTARRAIAVELDPDVFFVGPDNGLVTYLWDESNVMLRHAVSIDVPEGIAATFHGRDVFAPAAAELAAGASLRSLGDAVEDLVLLNVAFAGEDAYGVHGRVATVDHFGNAITTVRLEDTRGRPLIGAVWDSGRTDQVVATYDDIRDGSVAALVGSAGHVEIAARGAPASALGGPAAHEAVTVLV